MREPARAQFIFQRAIEVAHQVGALNRSGLAALTMIEEIDILPVRFNQSRMTDAGPIVECLSAVHKEAANGVSLKRFRCLSS